MTNHRLIGAALSAIACIAGEARAQVSSATTNSLSSSTGTATSCPPGNGIHISVTSGTGSVSGDSTRSRPRDSSGINTIIDERRSIDTTIVFNTAQKTWTRTNLAAALSVGLQGQSRGGYSICAGVTALMPSATLTIRNARGRVHFAASFQDLMNAIRLGPGGQVPPSPRRL